MKKILILIIIAIGLIGVKVKALNIATTEDIYDIEDIFQIALNKDKNLYIERYIILKENDKILMITFKKENYEIVNNEVIVEHGTVYTKSNGVNTIETYNDIDIVITKEVYSNIENLINSKANIEYEQYRDRKNIVGIAMILLGIGIAILFVKE